MGASLCCPPGNPNVLVQQTSTDSPVSSPLDRGRDPEVCDTEVPAEKEKLDKTCQELNEQLNINNVLEGTFASEGTLQRNVSSFMSAPTHYSGSKFFDGSFDVQEAIKAGFHSKLNPPAVGEEVVCFSAENYKRRGTTKSLGALQSDGTGGVEKGDVGMMVEVQDNDGKTFKSYAAFLTPINDKEYSSICTPAEFESSEYYKLFSESSECPTRGQSKGSMIEWLNHMVDADGNHVEVDSAHQENMINAYEEHKTDASLHLYSMHSKLGARTELVLGRDYSLFYRALNNTLNHDIKEGLSPALILIKRMMFHLLYDDGDGSKLLHHATTLYKGDSQYPVPINMMKLREAAEQKTTIHIRQFTSTTSKETLARRYMHREDGSRGFFWKIDVPENFWGARNIKDLAAKPNEDETLFPPYSQFLVKSVDDEGCHVEAVPLTSKYCI